MPAGHRQNLVARRPAHPAAAAAAATARVAVDARTVEIVQRARLIVEVAEVDLEVAEGRLGPFHEVTWHFRNALAESRRDWDRLRAELGTPKLDAALARPSVAVLTLGCDVSGRQRVATFIAITGRAYHVEPVPGTRLAPVQWHIGRFDATPDDGLYYACRLADRSTQCDCAEWAYQADSEVGAPPRPCKHLAALIALGWL
ncbi:hypothetical protein EP7_000134 [Isosphaeraceae bacterium EP7]